MRYFWENDVIFSNSQPRLGTRKINGGRKFSQRKVQKTWVLLFVIDWNLARYLGHTYCVRKCTKMDIENLIIVALWSSNSKPIKPTGIGPRALLCSIHGHPIIIARLDCCVGRVFSTRVDSGKTCAGLKMLRNFKMLAGNAYLLNFYGKKVVFLRFVPILHSLQWWILCSICMVIIIRECTKRWMADEL